jgi:hypothetical protein
MKKRLTKINILEKYSYFCCKISILYTSPANDSEYIFIFTQHFCSTLFAYNHLLFKFENAFQKAKDKKKEKKLQKISHIDFHE